VPGLACQLAGPEPEHAASVGTWQHCDRLQLFSK
jgi:hypothetical protein